ncbi:hypothetical protein [Clostridium sp.]
MNSDRQTYILRTSSDGFNKFSINSSNRLIHEGIKNGEVVSRNNIVDNIKEYSAAIDSEDKIHIIYTEDNMELKYMVLPRTNNIVNIASAKKNHILSCISIKIIYASPHIFYTITDMQNNQHSICMSSIVNGIWQCSEIFQTIGPRYIQPYLLEMHDRKIYILLYLNYLEGKLALFRMNNSSGGWEELDRNIELKDSSNVSFIISPKNILIIAYNKLINRNFQTIIIYRSLITKKYKNWESRVLSNEDSNTLKPSIFFKKDKYYMTWVQGSKVVLKSSKDLIYWENIFTFDKYSNNFSKCCYMSNNSEDSNLKMNTTYLSNSINPYSLINTYFRDEEPKVSLNLDVEIPHENLLEQVVEFSQIKLNETARLSEGKSEGMVELLEGKLQEETGFLEAKLEKKIKLLDRELKEKKYENNIMKKNINYLNNTIGQHEDNIILLNKTQISSLRDFNFLRNNFLDKIISFHKEKDILLSAYNDKLWQLFMLIEEKDKLINDLYKKTSK